MSLRLQINLLLTAMMVLFVVVLVWLQIDSTRRGVNEEIQAAHRVATQVLTRVSFVYRRAGLDGMQEFLYQLGRVRANDITLHDSSGELLYESPPSPYKVGRDAPGWFAALVSTPPDARTIPLVGGHLTIVANPSRAILDGWDDLMRLLSVAVVVFALANMVIHWLAGRAIAPLARVVDGLRAVARGQYDTRLPLLPGQEGATIGEAFNGMAQAIEDGQRVRREAAESAARLAQNRELTQLIQARIEQERGAIARELHDEMGQSLTAIKSLGVSIAQRVAGRSGTHGAIADDDAIGQSAQTIVDAADHLYQVVHGILPRLRPLALDSFGLTDALEDLLGDWRLQQPGTTLSLRLRDPPGEIGDSLSTAIYRIVQEAVTNAIRHARADRIDVDLGRDGPTLMVRISDNGQGLPGDWQKPEHYGVIGMRERAEALGGTLELQSVPAGGTSVIARIPLGEGARPEAGDPGGPEGAG
jgi:two-component system sensor histidine kinase UhpB